MTGQIDLFGGSRETPGPDRPDGFRYQSELIGAHDEAALLTHVRALPFREFEFHGHTGKRRVVSFGWKYDFDERGLRKVDDMPEFLLSLRAPAAEFAGLDAATLQHALVTEYGPGAGIGWHRDKSVFAEVVGISLLAPCVLRLRRRTGNKWDRVNVLAEPRSAYLLSGVARTEWEHSIPPVSELRYSITFRSIREND